MGLVAIGDIVVTRIFRVDLCIFVIVIVEISDWTRFCDFFQLDFSRKKSWCHVSFIFLFLAFYYHCWYYYLVI